MPAQTRAAGEDLSFRLWSTVLEGVPWPALTLMQDLLVFSRDKFSVHRKFLPRRLEGPGPEMRSRSVEALGVSWAYTSTIRWGFRKHLSLTGLSLPPRQLSHALFRCRRNTRSPAIEVICQAKKTCGCPGGQCSRQTVQSCILTYSQIPRNRAVAHAALP